ncbi:polysaccharide deacetylase family protein [Nonomuraea longicatena]|uniref:NodB homology domain-containing protein n=1 Tax=Nonomuraea longicatena TaxID=83682 RepID=A0ABN1QW68_9ACTN
MLSVVTRVAAVMVTALASATLAATTASATSTPEPAVRSYDRAPSASTTTAAAAPVVTRTQRDGKAVSFTFDDGPHPTYTPQVLDLLAQNQLKATFCLVGTEVEKYPDLVRRINAEGHALCNHSWQHDSMQTKPVADIRADLTRTSNAIRAAVPNAVIKYYRAPYGEWGASPDVAQELGMTSVGWSVDPRDWALPGADAIAQSVRTNLRDTGVVLLHDAGGVREQTVSAVRVLLPELKAAGWFFDVPQDLNGAVNCTGIPAWSPTQVYTGGQSVTHAGRKWTAKWWTQNNTPGTNDVWSNAGLCPV